VHQQRRAQSRAAGERIGRARGQEQEAAASIHGLLRRTLEAGSREIVTVAAQDEFVSPSRQFAVETV
jgi:pyridoxine kinase